MHVAQNWRLNGTRYALKGLRCAKCGNVSISREVCQHCRESEAKTHTAQSVFVIDGLPSETVRAAR